MWCPNCGTKLEDGGAFCPECGTKVQDDLTTPEYTQNDDLQYREEFPPEYEDDNSSKGFKRPMGFLIVILLAGLLIGIGAYAFVSGRNADKKEEVSEKVEESEDSFETNEDKDGNDENKDAEEPVDEYKEGEAPEEEPVVITASLAAVPASTGPYTKLGVLDASASSVIAQEGHDNSADMVLDGRDETSWQEGVDGTGTGESLTFDFDREYKVKYISFKLGNWRTEDYYRQNNRPKTLEIITDSSVSTVTFPNSREEYWVEFSEECPTSRIQIVVKDVYRGTSSKWNDTCVAGIEMYGMAQ